MGKVAKVIPFPKHRIVRFVIKRSPDRVKRGLAKILAIVLDLIAEAN